MNKLVISTNFNSSIMCQKSMSWGAAAGNFRSRSRSRPKQAALKPWLAYRQNSQVRGHKYWRDQSEGSAERETLSVWWWPSEQNLQYFYVPIGDEHSSEQRDPGDGGAGSVRPVPQGVLLHAPRHEQLLRQPPQFQVRKRDSTTELVKSLSHYSTLVVTTY